MHYGYHAQAARLKAGLTQRELAEAAGVGHAVVAWIETDRSPASLPSVLAITTALGIGINEYFGIRPTKRSWQVRTGSIGAYARSVREEKGISMRLLSKMTGVSASNICHLELGKGTTRMPTILLLSRALGVSPDEYIGSPYQGWRT